MNIFFSLASKALDGSPPACLFSFILEHFSFLSFASGIMFSQLLQNVTIPPATDLCPGHVFWLEYSLHHLPSKLGVFSVREPCSYWSKFVAIKSLMLLFGYICTPQSGCALYNIYEWWPFLSRTQTSRKSEQYLCVPLYAQHIKELNIHSLIE